MSSVEMKCSKHGDTRCVKKKDFWENLIAFLSIVILCPEQSEVIKNSEQDNLTSKNEIWGPTIAQQ